MGPLANNPGWGDLAEEEVRVLRNFAHHGMHGGGMQVLTTDEATAWTQERTGPRGGANYRLCKVCCPTLP
ncbi:hypothetical protein ACIQF6_34030 [Kitasatospora sp. NPDC092948]|uniref:hypothetical protein n=1 Tax=Kitasatospora sp. NPDC092948 TaxID=3364088 RepID=UPI00382463F6